MKRTAASIVLAVAALAMLVALVLQSRSLPLDVHLSQNEIAAEIDRVSEDFSTLVTTLRSANAEMREPGEAAQSLLGRVTSSPDTLRPVIETIPDGAARQSGLADRLGSYSLAVDEAEQLARGIIDQQSEYAENVAFVRERGPEIIQQLRDLRLDEEAGLLFQLVVATLDFASPDGTVAASELRRQLGAVSENERISANVPREVERLGERVLAVVDGKAPLQRGLEELAETPVAERAAAVGTAARSAYGGAAASVEQARVMLSIYSVALLAVVGFAAFRLQASYRALNRSHAELAEFNESLEHRVEERTKELAGTLRDLKESQVQLVQAEKMSSLGQLVAGISHEINTPLLYLANNAELIQERIQLMHQFVSRCNEAFSVDAEQCKDRAEFQSRFIGGLKSVKKMLQQEDLEASLQDAEDLAKDSIEGLEDLTDMAQSLKDFSRLDRAPISSFDVNSGLDKTLTIARNVIKHKAEVRKFYGELPEIECSPSQVNQVFLNLLTNAAQAIETYGEIVVTTKRHGDEGVAISIADNGCGIPAEVIDKVRDPFFTTKEVGSGTGLGLSIVDEIIRSHGGTLDIESEVGRGSVFTVVLPIRHTQAGGDAPDELEPSRLDESDELVKDALAEAV